MKKISLLFVGLLFLVLVGFVSGVPDTEISYFYSSGCSHCKDVLDSGILDDVSNIEGVEVGRYLSTGDVGREMFLDFVGKFEIERSGVPFLVIEQDGEFSYLMGDVPIIEGLEDAIVNFEGVYSGGDYDVNEITLGVIVVAAFIDSINPCAFGVLLFLMLSLLNMGSAKRALRAGLVYTFVVFLVYFFVGLGIFQAMESFAFLSSVIYYVAAVLLLLLGFWLFKDVLFPKFGPTLKISSKAKPIIERVIRKGTIPAMIVLGIFVSLFELPCTGGIYLGILSLMSINKTFAISYLLLYNLIFVLPLIVLTYLIYRGMSPEVLQRWTIKERKWMKLASGVVLIALGVYILML